MRTELLRQQSELVRALMAGEPAPPGFAPDQLHSARDSLLHKRRREVKRAWRGLAGALGDRFDVAFDDFARSTPVAPGGPLCDGRAFARELARVKQIPAEARLEILAFDLRHKITAAGLKPRRGPRLVMAFHSAPRRLVIGVRVPLLGELWFSIRLNWHRAN